MGKVLPEEANRIRVLVIARQPVARAGLTALLADHPEAEVVGGALSVEEAVHLASQLRPDAAVALGSWAEGETLSTLCEELDRIATPVVLLASEGASVVGGSQPWPDGLAGVLPADATGDDVALALRAAARGLLVLDALFAGLLRQGYRSGSPTPEIGEALTERERDVLGLVALGLANKAIAARLGISDHTVKFHLGSIFGKLNAESRTEAVTIAARLGLIAL